MKLNRSLASLALGILVLNQAATASDFGTNTNPYLTITARNAFGLQAPPQPSVTDATPPPEKIALKGIMSVFGRNFALFKSGSGKGKNFLLAEGQRAGDIELVSVDAKSGTIEINSHGVVQTIALPKPPTLLSAPAAVVAANLAAPLNQNGNFPVTDFSAPQSAAMKNPGEVPVPIFPVALAGGSTGNSDSPGNNSSSADNSNSTENNPGSQSGDQPPPAAHKPPEPWWKIGSKNLEASRTATASLVLSGQAEPYPLTPFTPPGTPAALIGPGQLYFVSAAMNE